MRHEIRISVRDLVEFILRSGDIDNRKDTGMDPDAMQEGIRIHQKIQKSMPVGYRPEVTLREVFEDGDVELTVEGRADGIWNKEDEGKTRIIVDEIKSMYANLSYIENPKEVHAAQAKCYAAIYSKQEDIDEIEVQLTYCDIDTEEIKRFRTRHQQQELRRWFTGLIDEYMKWAHMSCSHMEERDASIAKLEFPYEYRPGQKEVAIDVFRAIKRSKNLFIQAPTGVGKTLSVIYPSLKAVNEKLAEKIFYLTAKTVTAGVAVDTFRLLMSSGGLSIKAVHITAKEKSCTNGEFECNPDACPYAEGHYDRINDAVFDIITNETIITRETVREYAEKHRVCPYEFSLDISDWCDAIIGDYNYAFDPRVRLKRYFTTGVQGSYILLVDEAHNLVQRACTMYSADIVKEDVLACGRMTKGMDKRLTAALNSLNKKLLALKRECGGEYLELADAEESDIDSIGLAVTRVYFALSSFLEKQKYFDTRDEVMDFFFKIKSFLDVYEGELTGYIPYAKILDDGSFMVKLLCVDPSENLNECLASARSSIFFSATLLPITYYKELVSGNPDDYAIYADTSFVSEQRLLAAATDVSSKYTRRNASEYKKIADYISKVTSARKGNYMVFFPSYDFMNRVSEYIDGDFIMQNAHMSESEREEFLACFDSEREDTLIGLCVMGGIFAEGIDLTDEKLIGAVIVGTGLPMINTESEIAKKYFDEQGRDGFAYAYRYPGMNKVMQAAGRVIRKETDRGVILLLDERFNYSEYRSIFPKEWTDCGSVNIGNVESRVRSFWGLDRDT